MIIKESEKTPEELKNLEPMDVPETYKEPSVIRSLHEEQLPTD